MSPRAWLAAALWAAAGTRACAGAGLGQTFGVVEQLHPGFWQSDAGLQVRLWGRLASGYYHFKAEPRVDAAPSVSVSSVVLFLDLDNNRETGFDNSVLKLNQPNGTEAYLTVTLSGGQFTSSPQLFSGCAPEGGSTCRALRHTLGASDFARTTAGVEFRVAQSVLAGIRGAAVDDLSVSARLAVTDSSSGATIAESAPVFLLDSLPLYTTLGALPACGDAPTRSAVLFSQDEQQLFYDERAYAQLFMAMQSQLRQSGIPYARITLEQLLDYSSSCKYDVVLIPTLRIVRPAQVFAVRKALHVLSHYYQVGIVVAGDVATNRWPDGAPQYGEPYGVARSMLGVGPASPSSFARTIHTEYRVVAAGHPIVRPLSNGAVLANTGKSIANVSHAITFVNMFAKPADSRYLVQGLVAQRLIKVGSSAATEADALLVSQLPAAANPFQVPGGRVVHFSNLELLANLDLAWRAVRWAARKPGGATGATLAGLSLQIGRHAAIMSMRNDMDISKFANQAPTVESEYVKDLTRWHDAYNFVGTHYLNVGENASALEPEFTNWSVAKPIYSRILAAESDLGSHTAAHPMFINRLPDAEIVRQYVNGLGWIEGNMSVSGLGAAQPGDPETLRTLYLLAPTLRDRFYSGGYSGVGSGYPNAFGYVDANSSMVVMMPNIFFDFSGVEFLKWTPQQCADFWMRQLDNLTSTASTAIIHWPIHDYAVTDWGDALSTANGGEGGNTVNGQGAYTLAMFEDFIAYAFGRGVEFVLGNDLRDRLRLFPKATLTVVADAAAPLLTATVPALPGESFGACALLLHQDEAPAAQVIQSVDGWFAYSADRVFLPRQGGSFPVRLGATAPVDPPTHIVDLDMRMVLESVSGDGKTLSFSVTGRGAVRVQLTPGLLAKALYVFPAAQAGVALVLDSATSIAVITFAAGGPHAYAITLKPTLAPTPAPAITLKPILAPTPAPAAQPSAQSSPQPTEPTAAPSATAQSSKADAGGVSSASLVGAVLGAAVAVVAAAVGVVVYRKRQLQRRRTTPADDVKLVV
jgi:hypothetical protein